MTVGMKVSSIILSLKHTRHLFLIILRVYGIISSLFIVYEQLHITSSASVALACFLLLLPWRVVFRCPYSWWIVYSLLLATIAFAPYIWYYIHYFMYDVISWKLSSYRVHIGFFAVIGYIIQPIVFLLEGARGNGKER